MKIKILKSVLFLCIIISIILINLNPIINAYNISNEEKQNIITNVNRNILLTGFWTPTGRMLIPFSNDLFLNPSGWKGENWGNYGFDIYSYFPNPGVYNGTFEVDYQDTWEDFWDITSELNPIAIISFGAGNGPWEIEYNARNLDSWINDEKFPYQPNPCPPDDTVEVDYVRHSTLPVEQIKDSVNDGTNINAWIDWDGNPGKYLCEYIAYLGMWYKDMHSSLDDPYQCKSAGFIHVRSNIHVDEAMIATNITIIKTIEYLLSLNNPPSLPAIEGPSSGKFGEEQSYNLMSTDPDGDELFYIIDWGDSKEETYGPFPSGENIEVGHIWDEKGTYLIRLKSKDIYGSESDWSTLEVSMMKAKSINTLTLKRLITRFQFFNFSIRNELFIRY